MSTSGVGEQLRLERLRQGLSLEDVVQRTRISPRSLEAIEADALDRLPGLVFARNFVRLYAQDLKLDADALLAKLPRVDIEAAPLPIPPAGSRQKHWDPRLTASLASLLWIATAAGAGTGAWYYYNHYGRHAVASVAATPAPSAKTVVAAVTASPAVGETQNSARIPSPETNSVSTQTVSTSSAMPSGFDSNRPVQVVLTAREAAWVQISADGRTAFVGTLRQHESRTIAADAQVKVMTGNAGGLDISLNGKPLDPIGPSGQVRTVRLTAEGPQFVPRTPPASSPL